MLLLRFWYSGLDHFRGIAQGRHRPANVHVHAEEHPFLLQRIPKQKSTKDALHRPCKKMFCCTKAAAHLDSMDANGVLVSFFLRLFLECHAFVSQDFVHRPPFPPLLSEVISRISIAEQTMAPKGREMRPQGSSPRAFCPGASRREFQLATGQTDCGALTWTVSAFAALQKPRC